MKNKNIKNNSKKLTNLNKLTIATMGIILLNNTSAFANTNNNYYSNISNLYNLTSNNLQNNDLSWLNCNNIFNNNNNSNNNNNTNNNNSNNNNNNNNSNNNNNPNNNFNSSVSSIEQEVVRLVNLERAKHNLQPLILDLEVSAVARLKSQDMNSKKYFSHTSPTYGSPFDMLKSFNISYKTAGENIAKGQKTAQAVVTAWLNSEGHRRNILSSSFTHIGVGFDNYHWTQLFITK